MPEFAYTARTLNGEDVAGTISAGSKRETLRALTERVVVSGACRGEAAIRLVAVAAA
jgi:type II secretory pathway component PulF